MTIIMHRGDIFVKCLDKLGRLLYLIYISRVKYIIYGMIGLVLSMGFKDMLHVSLYIFQKEALTKSVCVNKKSKKCKGKCYLIKKIKESHQDNSNGLPQNDQISCKDYFLLTPIWDLKAQLIIRKKISFIFISPFSETYVYETFDPPDRWA